jgi:uncharacterized iron-regulated membrane protein
MGHRYMGLLFVIALIAVMLTGGPDADGIAQRIQQVLMLLLAISGIYLFVLPFWARWQKKQKAHTKAQAEKQ